MLDNVIPAEEMLLTDVSSLAEINPAVLEIPVLPAVEVVPVFLQSEIVPEQKLEQPPTPTLTVSAVVPSVPIVNPLSTLPQQGMSANGTPPVMPASRSSLRDQLSSLLGQTPKIVAAPLVSPASLIPMPAAPFVPLESAPSAPISAVAPEVSEPDESALYNLKDFSV